MYLGGTAFFARSVPPVLLKLLNTCDVFNLKLKSGEYLQYFIAYPVFFGENNMTRYRNGNKAVDKFILIGFSL